MWIFGGETTSWLASPVEKPSSLRKLWRIAFHSAQDPFDVGGGVVYVGQILNRLPNLPNVTRGNDWTPWKTLLPKDQALTSAAMTGRVGWQRSWRSLGKLSFFFVKWNSPKNTHLSRKHRNTSWDVGNRFGQRLLWHCYPKQTMGNGCILPTFTIYINPYTTQMYL